MLAWLSQNLATIIISAVLLAVVVLIIINMVKKKHKGQSSCGCSCNCCAMGDACHDHQENCDLNKSKPK